MASGNTHIGIGLVEKGVLGQVELPTRSPELDEVLFRVEYAALCAADGHAIDDNFYVPGYPSLVGLGAAGKVVGVGSNVDWIKEGDAVPSGTSPAEVAGLIDNFVCAWHTISTSFGLPLPAIIPPSSALDPEAASSPVLVWGAGTGAGIYIVQALRVAGYKTIIATASPRSAAPIQSYGATHVFDYNDPDVVAKIKEAAGGKPVKYAVDPVCTQTSIDRISKVADTPGSKVGLLIPIKIGSIKSVSEGGAQLLTDLPAEANPFAKGVDVLIVRTFQWEANDQWKRTLLKDILPALLRSGQIKPQEVRIINKEPTLLERVKEAHRLMKNNELHGAKAVVDFNAAKYSLLPREGGAAGGYSAFIQSEHRGITLNTLLEMRAVGLADMMKTPLSSQLLSIIISTLRFYSMATVEQQVLSATQGLTLSSPLKVGDVELHNRNIMAAMTRNRSIPVNVPNGANVEYYTQRAEGGAGLIVTEGVLVSPQGTNWPHAPGLWSKEQTVGWKKVTDSVHEAGGKIFAQLWHLGRIAHNDMPEQKKSGKPVSGPSPLVARGGEGHYARYGLSKEDGHSIPVPLEDPRTVIEEFKVAGANAKEAGFDGVEIHSANGYLINQFLDNTSNERTDEWGGSPENRSRSGLEVAKALVDIWGPGHVGVKISPCGGYNDMGAHPSRRKPDSYPNNLYHLLGKKRATPHDVLESYGPIFKRAEARTTTKLFLNGGLNPAEANELVGSGKIDGAVFGWLWIGNPDLQTRIEKGAELVFMPDAAQLFQSKTEDPRGGYSDYPKGTY
ncbi:hypothetical protein FS837_005330 [Tulasnella sp. UAMH 9824]|nr:hypothetical protein FS837_005330 [Tulasnella sp. UAMH 9824]